jgi:hypothetical protein
MGTRQGVWSPDGSRIAVESPANASSVVLIYDLQGVLEAWILEPWVADPSWATTVPAPPVIQVTMDPGTNGWTNRAQALVQATVPQGIADVSCNVDGGHPQPPTGNDPGHHFSFLGSVQFFPPDGDHTLSCTVTDDAGMSATDQVAFRMDATAPTLASFAAWPLVRRTDQVTNVGVVAADDLSGIDGAEIRYSGFRGTGSAPMTLRGAALRGSVGPGLADGMYSLSANVRDRAGNEASLGVPLGSFIVFDTASHTVGQGRFVPTTSTATLPGIDGRSPLRFRFGIRYGRPRASRPMGWLGFDYAHGGVHVKATSFDWLAHFDDRTYQVLGTATVLGQPGSFRFRATIMDGTGTNQDRFDIVLWPEGSPEPSSLFDAAYAAGSYVSGTTIVNDGPLQI